LGVLVVGLTALDFADLSMCILYVPLFRGFVSFLGTNRFLVVLLFSGQMFAGQSCILWDSFLWCMVFF
jgi:hypothetical protein